MKLKLSVDIDPELYRDDIIREINQQTRLRIIQIVKDKLNNEYFGVIQKAVDKSFEKFINSENIAKIIDRAIKERIDD